MPGIGSVLRRYGLDGEPEAHRHLAYNASRIDLTRAGLTHPIEHFFHEESIEREEIGAYKVDIHEPMGVGARP